MCMIQDGKRFSKLNGRATSMVTKKTPMLRSFNRKQGSVVASFYVRSYLINNFLTDLSLQKIMKSNEDMILALAGQFKQMSH